MRARPVVRAALLATVAVATLAGCVKVDMDLKVSSNDKISGTAIVAVDEALLRLTGQSKDEFFSQMSKDFDPKSAPAGASEKLDKYDEGGFVGAKVTFTNVPIDHMGSLGSGSSGSSGGDTSNSSFQLTREGNVFTFHGTLDTSSTAPGSNQTSTDISLPDLSRTAKLRVKLTFPGAIIETNGHKDGNSVTWNPKFGEKTEMTATANATGGGGGGSGAFVWVIVIGVVVLAVVALVAFLLMRKGRRLPPPPPAAANWPAPTSPLPPPGS